MKNIIIVTNQMIRGGVENALISMLNTIDMTRVNVTVLLLRKGGAWEKRIPKTVRVLYVDELNDPKKYLIRLARQGRLLLALKKARLFYRSTKAKNYWEENDILTEFLPKIQQNYDVAIAYHAPGTLPVHYVLRNIKAENKILWMHGDVEKTKSIGDEYRRLYLRYDRIVCVSREAERVFLKNFPETKPKCRTVHNVIDTQNIDRAVNLVEKTGYTICTVARLSPEKGIDLAVEACALLVKQHPEIRWCVCGGGSEEKKIRKLLTDKRLGENFFLLGEQDNPYQYMASSEIYVQPSIHEGYCMTIAEARYLCKPIVATCTTGSMEQLTDRINSTIVGIDAHEIASAVDELLSNHFLQRKYETQLRQEKTHSDCDNIMEAICS